MKEGRKECRKQGRASYYLQKFLSYSPSPTIPILPGFTCPVVRVSSNKTYCLFPPFLLRMVFTESRCGRYNVSNFRQFPPTPVSFSVAENWYAVPSSTLRLLLRSYDCRRLSLYGRWPAGVTCSRPRVCQLSERGRFIERHTSSFQPEAPRTGQVTWRCQSRRQLRYKYLLLRSTRNPNWMFGIKRRTDNLMISWWW